MNGEVGISSELGKGTTIWSIVRLARIQSESSECRMAVPSPHFSSPESVTSRLSPQTTVDSEDDRSDQGYEGEDIGWRANCRILVAEDNVVNQKVLAHMLKRLGYKHIVLTDNGLQAVDEIRRSWTDTQGHFFDLVLMDCLMPVMDGQDASRAIRAMESQFISCEENAGDSYRVHVPIVALTASALNSDRDLCLTSGMDDFVTKPIDMCRLDEIISKWAEPLTTKHISV
ncbi:NIK1 [Symbiodinium microadriaticum]|nr:NIK1 [Symbiodinium microadriaticum]